MNELRAKIEHIVWHAMTSMSMSNLTLADARAASPSVKGNYDLSYLGNAVDAIEELIISEDAAHTTPLTPAQHRKVAAYHNKIYKELENAGSDDFNLINFHWAAYRFHKDLS
jgi:hypothetical protein